MNEVETAAARIRHHKMLLPGQRWIRSAVQISSITGGFSRAVSYCGKRLV